MEWQHVQEDELAFAKGCFSGFIVAIPLWTIIMIIVKYVILKIG